MEDLNKESVDDEDVLLVKSDDDGVEICDRDNESSAYFDVIPIGNSIRTSTKTNEGDQNSNVFNDANDDNAFYFIGNDAEINEDGINEDLEKTTSTNENSIEVYLPKLAPN